MIMLTKLDGTPILLNVEAIKYFEKGGDTRVIFVNGDAVIIKESLEQIKDSMVKLKSSILKHSMSTDDSLRSK